MSNQHTPGPWLTEGNLIYALDETGRVDRFCARVFQPSRIRASSPRTPDAELQANVSLITAAPDLLEALETAVEWDSHDSKGVPAVWLESALAAIAKARGQS